MKVSLSLTLILMLASSHNIAQTEAFSVVNVGPLGPATFYSLEICESTIECELTLNIHDDDTRSVSGKFILPFDLNNLTMLSFYLDKYENNEWTKHFIGGEYVAIDFINQFLKLAWHHFLEAITPPITDPELIKAGTYELTEFREKHTSVAMKFSSYGRYRSTIELFHNDETFYCFKSEFDANPA